MHIVVVGAGAMGGLLGTRLAASGQDVLLYDIWTEHVEAIERLGMSIEGLDGTIVRYRVRATDRPPLAIGGADLVLVEVKAHDTYDALRPFSEALKPDAYVLSLQNGLGNIEQMRRALPHHERILIGTSAHGATVLGPGRIRHAGRGPTAIGDPTLPATPRFDLSRIKATLSGAGFETEIVPNVHSAVWAKLISNVAINPLTALTGLRNGELLDDPDIWSLVEQVVAEALAVMHAAGVPPMTDDHLQHARRVMEATRPNVSSMLQDIRRGKRTEIEAINGAVVRLGEELGVPTPVNRWITAMVRRREIDARRGMEAASAS
ncbi:MAG TPA: 2-dehydropantoate 2-reductase [Thermomicrobiales bacterium]|nr:2-dehydropantoate 2-reductase [Thermomicrobiales bacterium]